ncbi:AAA family ATPase [Pseudonocardia xishanensis]|uniref:AAA family ATPase n=1 Tax=Pseudonocardia xishanensis TaxID=630995 RepID=A0ABP8RTT6_9PSEU
MKFYPLSYGDRVSTKEYPHVLLYKDNWDDYHFKTTFVAELWNSKNDIVRLGEVKILDLRLPPSRGRTELPDEFERLSDSFVSLGQAFTYYELLQERGPGVYEPILEALQDVLYSPERQAAAREHPAFETSLLRAGSAERALEDAPRLFWHGASGADEPSELAFSFRTQVGGSSFDIGFTFGDTKHLPNRINAVIGYNGVGKTTLLANLAMVASADQNRRASADFQAQYGELLENTDSVAFGSTIAVSYSAFDTFELPGGTREERLRVEKRGELFGYSYCGLRKFDDDLGGPDSPVDEEKRGGGEGAALKGSGEILDEFLRSLKLAQSESARDILEAALSTLALEPSFSDIGMQGFLDSSNDFDTARKELARSSTGHKIVLNIVVQLVAHLQEKSLVLIDEPESHLHPPLLAALLRSVSVALQRRDSFAVVATHSPVVLQEIPRRHVRVLRRFGEITRVDLPEEETFGENIGFLTRTVFNLDSSQTDYHRVLNSLVQRFSLQEIEEMFDGAMSSQARAYVVGELRRRRANQ